MTPATLRRLFITLTCCALSPMACAIPVCELNGEHVNPANGHTTQGKTGLMRCREGEGGPLVREQELKDGTFIGVVRYFKNGILEREYSVNERGNKEGLSREYAATAGPNNALIAEETYKNGTALGLTRRWHANGQLERASFHSEDRREQASAEFTSQGKLRDLRCAPQAQLAPAVDDATWCGHKGKAHTSALHNTAGAVAGSITYEQGRLRRRESLWADGKPRDQMESDDREGVERNFLESGVKRREQRWVNRTSPEGRSYRTVILERDFHDPSGTLVRERQWKPTERGSELKLDQRWYLNGQLKQRLEYLYEADLPIEKETEYHDNGRVRFEGSWTAEGRFSRRALGVHKSFDAQGRLASERHHDTRGRVSRERQFDEAGTLVRDDELFEDGSRKTFKR